MTLSEKTRAVIFVVVVAIAIVWVKEAHSDMQPPPEIRVDGMQMIYVAYIFKVKDQCWFYIKSDDRNQLMEVECPNGKGLWN